MKIRRKINDDKFLDIIISQIFTLIAALYPFFLMVLYAFRTYQKLFLKPLQLPEHYDFNVYKDAWKQANFTAAFKTAVSLQPQVYCLYW